TQKWGLILLSLAGINKIFQRKVLPGIPVSDFEHFFCLTDIEPAILSCVRGFDQNITHLLAYTRVTVDCHQETSFNYRLYVPFVKVIYDGIAVRTDDQPTKLPDWFNR